MQIGTEVEIRAVLDNVQLRFNSQHNPTNPCVGRVVKIGRKYVHVQATGGPIRAIPPGGDETGAVWRAIPV